MSPEAPTPAPAPAPEEHPVDSWATWYANECRENAVEATVRAAPSFNPVLVPDISSDVAREPTLDALAPGVSPPPIAPNVRED